MIYVASPYSHKDTAVRQQRVDLVKNFTARGINLGFIMFSPVVYSDAILSSKRITVPSNHGIWMPFDLAILRHCEAVYVLDLSGWKESKGVTIELAVCETLNIPVVHYKPDEEKFILASPEFKDILPSEF